MRGVVPTDAAVVLKTLLDVWSTASERMLLTVARYLARGLDAPDWATRKLRETLALRGELESIVARLAGASPGLADRAVVEAYGIGARVVDIVGEPVVSRPEVVQALAVRLADRLRGSFVPVVSSHTDLYRRTVTEVELVMQTGTITRREAVATVVDRLQVEGVERFPDASGRRWHLDTYARMAGRTTAGQAAVQGQLDTMIGQGRDLVIVSDSPRECPACRPWEGRLLSITGRSVGVVVDGRRAGHTVAEAIAAGLHHPNCTHRLDPYVPGLTRKKPPTAAPEGYRAQQHQRALERGLRDVKRRRLVAKQIGDRARVRALDGTIREYGRRLAAHTEQHGLLRKRDREQPVGG